MVVCSPGGLSLGSGVGGFIPVSIPDGDFNVFMVLSSIPCLGVFPGDILGVVFNLLFLGGERMIGVGMDIFRVCREMNLVFLSVY